MSSRTNALYIASIAAHVGLAVSVARIDERPRREIVAIAVSDTKEEPEPEKKPEVAPPKETPPENKPPPPRPAARATEEAPAPEAASPTAALDALPDFGLELSGGGAPGGFAVAAPTPNGAAKAREETVTKTAAPKVLAAAKKADVDECADPAVKPKPISVSQPAYSSAAREAGVEGKVRVEVSVDADGHVKSVRLISGLGHGLDEAALEAARRATFQPGTRCGKPVAATFVIAMRFSI